FLMNVMQQFKVATGERLPSATGPADFLRTGGNRIEGEGWATHYLLVCSSDRPKLFQTSWSIRRSASGSTCPAATPWATRRTICLAGLDVRSGKGNLLTYWVMNRRRPA